MNIVLFYVFLICMVNCVMSKPMPPVTVEIDTQVNSANTNGSFQISFDTTLRNNVDLNGTVLLTVNILNLANFSAESHQVFYEEIALLDSYTSNVYFNVEPGEYEVTAKVFDYDKGLGAQSMFLAVDNEGIGTIQELSFYFGLHPDSGYERNS